MIDRRRVVRLALAALPAAVLTRAVHAQQAFERFYPFLIDLPGWTGDKPDGLAMQLPGNNNMMTATRAYRHEGAKLNVQVITGPAAQGGLAMIQSGMKLETGDRSSTSALSAIQDPSNREGRLISRWPLH